MKSNTTFIFAGIMSAIIGNAYATGENIVTSKSYVDNALEQKQDNISAEDDSLIEGQQDVTGMRAVLAPTDEPGVVNQIGLWDAAGDRWAWDIDEYFSSNTVGEREEIRQSIPTVGAVELGLNDKQNKKTCAGWPDGTTTYDTTHTDANCWLWTFPD